MSQEMSQEIEKLAAAAAAAAKRHPEAGPYAGPIRLMGSFDPAAGRRWAEDAFDAACEAAYNDALAATGDDDHVHLVVAGLRDDDAALAAARAERALQRADLGDVPHPSGHLMYRRLLRYVDRARWLDLGEERQGLVPDVADEA